MILRDKITNNEGKLMQRDLPENKAFLSSELDSLDFDLSDYDTDMSFDEINPFACDDYDNKKPSMLDKQEEEERTFREVRKILNSQRLHDPFVGERKQHHDKEKKQQNTHKQHKKETKPKPVEKIPKSEKVLADEETKKRQKEIKDKIRKIRNTIKDGYKTIKSNEQYEKNFPSKEMKNTIKVNRQRYVDLLLFEMAGIHKNHPDYSKFCSIHYIILTKYMVDFINASTERRLDRFICFSVIQFDFKNFIEIKQQFRSIQIKINDFYQSQKASASCQQFVDYLLFEMAGVQKTHPNYPELSIINDMMLIKYMDDFFTKHSLDNFTYFSEIQFHFRNYILENLADKLSEIVDAVAEIKVDTSQSVAATPPRVTHAEAQSGMLQCLNSLLHTLHNISIQLRVCLSHIKMPSCVFFRRKQEDLDDGMDHKHTDDEKPSQKV